MPASPAAGRPGGDADVGPARQPAKTAASRGKCGRRRAARGCRTLAFEAQEMTVERHCELSALDGCPQLVPLGHVVEQLRMVKDETEIALLARACAITCEAFADTLPSIVPGRSSGTAGRARCPNGLPSPSSLGSTCPAKAEPASRTPSLSAQALGRRRYSPRPPRNCSSCNVGAPKARHQARRTARSTHTPQTSAPAH